MLDLTEFEQAPPTSLASRIPDLLRLHATWKKQLQRWRADYPGRPLLESAEAALDLLQEGCGALMSWLEPPHSAEALSDCRRLVSESGRQWRQAWGLWVEGGRLAGHPLLDHYAHSARRVLRGQQPPESLGANFQELASFPETDPSDPHWAAWHRQRELLASLCPSSWRKADSQLVMLLRRGQELLDDRAS